MSLLQPNDAVLRALVIIARSRATVQFTPATLVDRLHRADADGVFDGAGPVYDEADVSAMVERFEEDYT